MTDHTATSPSLYGQLRDSHHLDGLDLKRKYISNKELLEIVMRENIITELNAHRKRWSLGRMRRRSNSNSLATRVLDSGKKLFAILGILCLPSGASGVKDLLDAGFTDEDLPLSKRENHLSSSLNSEKRFEWPAEWGVDKFDGFTEKQWLVLAPIFRTEGAHRTLAPECPLPFVSVEPAQNGLNNVVYKAVVDPSHQVGFEAESPSLAVALKEFRFEEHFETERSNLNRIRGLSLNKHITQNFETFSQGNKSYIMFPWAEGGDLDNFWQTKNSEARSSQLALWCLRQMLGLTEALDFLHNQIGISANLRHGDLKPGNILHFFIGETYGILKIADFGISRVHDVGTLQRYGIATTTRATTPSYQAPEANFRDRPRSRKFDIWSLGCIFLEFTVWFVRDWEAVENFSNARKSTAGDDGMWAHFYQKKDSTAEGGIKVHPAVTDNIKSLRRVAQRAEVAAFRELLDTIESKLLRIEVEDRVDAKTLCELLTGIVDARTRGDQD